MSPPRETTLVAVAQPSLPHRATEGSVDLYWLPLGAGGCVVRFNGRVYEALHAVIERRSPLALYHCALEVRIPDGCFVIELTPVFDGNGAERGVVSEGPVGRRWLGRFRLFRYELRCWRNGVIPDVGQAVESPQRLTDDPRLARRLLGLAASVPTPVWGRDELRTGEMWNSNSVISWLLARSGVPVALAKPPSQGRAPGWNAGLVVAWRQQQTEDIRQRPDERARRHWLKGTAWDQPYDSVDADLRATLAGSGRSSMRVMA